MVASIGSTPTVTRTDAEQRPLPAARRVGAVVGAGVAVACLLVPAMLSAAQGSIQNWPDSIPGWVAAAGPSIAAGTIGGFAFGPFAAGADDKSTWAGVVFGLALVATVAGALLTGVLGTVQSAESLAEVPGAAANGLALGLLGLVIFGWFAGPVLLVPAMVWALVMRLLRRG
jgi:hypothetical protein